ncbi:hypothetical protein Nepgr_005191 [Nepenthes gracilis]|uniref:Uncharacterized protein n=1 Tax=Nepenthes gracilis TaxID=150966 RepID=A0AAD3S2Q3_NEPGR|nr:hypothetical protein Nepgr_005191 [Nepenthes gracilis]
MSTVGLLPAALQGIDIKEMLGGASLMDEATRNNTLKSNLAALLVLCWYWASDGVESKDMAILPYKDSLLLFRKETLRCIAWALKRIPMGQQLLAFEDEKDVTLIELAGMLDTPREEVQDAILPCTNVGIRVVIVAGDDKTTAKSLCRKIGAFDHLEEFVGYSYTTSKFEEIPALQKTIALQRFALFTRVEPSLPVFASTKQLKFLGPAPIQIAVKLGPNDLRSQDAAA